MTDRGESLESDAVSPYFSLQQLFNKQQLKSGEKNMLLNHNNGLYFHREADAEHMSLLAVSCSLCGAFKCSFTAEIKKK